MICCVAQIFNLRYRGIEFCGAREKPKRACILKVLPIENRRYGRVELSATIVARVFLRR
jgi:hypothetical protein